MKINKDTKKAIDAATTLIKYCARYKQCKGCIFHQSNSMSINPFCCIGYPFEYKEIKEGVQDEKISN